MDAPQFAAALKARRAALGLSQTAAAERLGIPFRTYQNYETETSAPRSDERMRVLLDALTDDDDGDSPARDLLSIVGGGEAGAGMPRSNDGADVEVVLISRAEVTRSTRLSGREADALRWFVVVGDSMEPEFGPGERVFYLPSDAFTGDGFYVVDVDGERTLKRIQRLGGGAFDFVPVNSAYAVERFTPVPDAEPNTFRSNLSGLTTTLRFVGKVSFNLRAR